MRGRRAGEWTGEMTSGRIRTRVLHGPQARMWCVVGATGCATVPPVLCYFKFFLSGLLCYAVARMCMCVCVCVCVYVSVSHIEYLYLCTVVCIVSVRVQVFGVCVCVCVCV